MCWRDARLMPECGRAAHAPTLPPLDGRKHYTTIRPPTSSRPTSTFIPHFSLYNTFQGPAKAELMRVRRHSWVLDNVTDFLLRLVARRWWAIFSARRRKRASSGGPGLPLCDARLTQALILPPSSRPLHGSMAELRRCARKSSTIVASEASSK